MATVLKKNYFDVLDDIANKYKNTVPRTIQMKPIDVTSGSYAEYNEDSNVTKPKFKNGDHFNTKTFLLKHTLTIGQKRFLLLAKLKKKFHGHT